MKKIALLLFGRYIRKKAYIYSGPSITKAEEMYGWITGAPVRLWHTRLWCARYSHSYKKLYEWLIRPSEDGAALRKQ